MRVELAVFGAGLTLSRTFRNARYRIKQIEIPMTAKAMAYENLASNIVVFRTSGVRKGA
jgi:hypothetical protein